MSPVEIKGQQLRIRVRSPTLFKPSSYRTQDVGEKGKLQRVAARTKKGNKWETQSWRLNLTDYENRHQAYADVHLLESKKQITHKQATAAKKKLKKVF